VTHFDIVFFQLLILLIVILSFIVHLGLAILQLLQQKKPSSCLDISAKRHIPQTHLNEGNVGLRINKYLATYISPKNVQ